MNGDNSSYVSNSGNITESGHAVKKLHVDTRKEGIKKIVGKYESPENLFITQSTLTKVRMNEIDQTGSENCPAMSECSSDLSDAPPSWASMFNVTTNYSEGVTDQDILQAETFYKSHKTEVCVCKCLANLYYSISKKVPGNGSQWEFHNTGVPVFILDTGEHHRQRKLSIILAEKGTGFTLWRDNISHLTKYTLPSVKFHTMFLSSDHTRQVGFSFDDGNAATEFYTFIASLFSDPHDDLFNLSSKKKNKKKKEKPKLQYKAPKKQDISQPCCFVHVTKLERPDFPPPPSRLVGDISDIMATNLAIPHSASSVSGDSTVSEHS